MNRSQDKDNHFHDAIEGILAPWVEVQGFPYWTGTRPAINYFGFRLASDGFDPQDDCPRRVFDVKSSLLLLPATKNVIQEREGNCTYSILQVGSDPHRLDPPACYLEHRKGSTFHEPHI